MQQADDKGLSRKTPVSKDMITIMREREIRKEGKKYWIILKMNSNCTKPPPLSYWNVTTKNLAESWGKGEKQLTTRYIWKVVNCKDSKWNYWQKKSEVVHWRCSPPWQLSRHPPTPSLLRTRLVCGKPIRIHSWAFKKRNSINILHTDRQLFCKARIFKKPTVCSFWAESVCQALSSPPHSIFLNLWNMQEA